MIGLQIFLTLLGLLGVSLSLVSLPGILLVYFSALIFGVYTNFDQVSTQALIITGLITLVSLLVDEIAALIGAKTYGASSKGILGAIVGGALGFLSGGPFGVLLGAFVGAIGGELFGNPDMKNAMKAGLGTFIGYLIGLLIKFIITLILFIWMLTVIW